MLVTIKRELAEIITLEKLKPFGIDEGDLFLEKIRINLAITNIEKIKTLKAILENVKDKRQTSIAIRDINTWIAICENKTVTIKKLEHFKFQLIQHLLGFKGKRIYTKYYLDEDIWLCSRVTRITYHRPTAFQPAVVEMNLVFKQFGHYKQSTHLFHFGDVQGKTVPEILIESGIFTETKELRQIYLEQTEKFNQIYRSIGKQFIANGTGDDEVPDKDDNDDDDDRRYRFSTKKFEFIENKVVIDVFDESDGTSREDLDDKINLGEQFWMHPFTKDDDGYFGDDDDEFTQDEGGENEITIEIPIHQFLIIFDLQRHLRLCVHVNFLTEYKYDKTLSEKLVLSSNNKELINILIEHKEGGFRDIVQNKTGGAIILLTGKAGVGKTLTAEVFAEAKEKPLYTVQASQLGVTPKKLEKHLMKVLSRASRWDAILLIDEADVYVHERGNDINQNAIVGVFLRVLEYHSSILFMTTNRPDIVDDAISSRCVAKIDYKYPTVDEQKPIWKILCGTSSISVDESTINQFVEKYNEFSGRDIKNLIKLANLKAKADKKKIDFETIEYVRQFNPTKIIKEINDKT